MWPSTANAANGSSSAKTFDEYDVTIYFDLRVENPAPMRNRQTIAGFLSVKDFSNLPGSKVQAMDRS
jgi:hypothetical protein